MLTFFADCAGLFTRTFNAAMDVAFFRCLAVVILMQLGLGLFFYIYRGSKKM